MCLIIPRVSGQDLQFNFTHFTVEDGLAHNHCYSIVQDTCGYLWIATENGLSRFDGHEFKNYRSEEKDSFSINGNWIRSVILDKDRNIWAGNMRGGLNQYHAETNGFLSFNPLSGDSFGLATRELTKILCDSNGEIWFGTFREGFGVFNPIQKTFESFTFGSGFRSPRQAWQENSVFAILEDIRDPDTLWVAKESSLYIFRKSARELQLVTEFKPAAKRKSSIHDLYMEKPGELWVAFWGAGLAKYDQKTDNWTHYPYNLDKFLEGDGYSNVCLDIEKKTDDEFWLACGLDGMGIFNMKTEEFRFVELPGSNNPGSKSGFAYDVYIDNNLGIWISDQLNGLYFIDPSRQLFRHVSTRIQQKGSRPGLNRPLDFDYHPETGQYLVATGQGDGLYIYDKAFNLLKTAPSSLPSPFSYQQFVSLHIDKKNRVWVIDWLRNKLLQYREELNLCIPVDLEKYPQYPQQPFTLNDIQEDPAGNLWISTYYGGLLVYNPDEKSLLHYLSEDPAKGITSQAQIETMHMARDGRIWLGTINFGIYIFDPETREFSTYPYYGISDKGLIEDRVHGICEDREGRIWVGFYTKGIQVIDPLLDPDQPQVRLDRQTGLLNEQILAIRSDLNRDMWVQTQGGVFKYDYDANRFTLFSDKEGLTGYLNPAGFEVIRTGELCIGGSEGFYVLHPGNEYINGLPPKVRLTGFRIGEKDYDPGKRIDFIEQLILPFRDNFFTLTFSGMNFQLPEKNQYAYRLRGVDPDWVITGERHHASYTNVLEGSYLFEVKAANNDGIWSESTAAIQIQINPPWYRSVLAYAFYGLFIVLVFLLILFYQRKRWELKTQLKLKAEEARRLQELDQAKSRIYTNITHEFRTPLTVILGMVEQIKIDPGKKLGERIDVIRRNSKSLLQLINQMLELSKLESGYLRLNWVHDDITRYIGYLTESFHSYANDKGIHLNFYAEGEPIEMDYDPEKIDRIFSNLLSNALKFTPEYGKVMVVARRISRERKDVAEIEVRDNGKGISEEDLHKIFDRFYQTDDSGTREQGGTGIGLALVNELVRLLQGEILVESEPGKGTCFTVRLPVLHTASKKHTLETLSEPVIEEPVSGKRHHDMLSDHGRQEKPMVLIIEDNNDVVYYLRNILEDRYEVHRAPDGIEGVRKANEIIPDVIISDVMMPGMDGFEVCETLKNSEPTSHIPIIILTAKASDEDRLAGLRKGADAYLKKPFSSEELLIRLEKLIAIREQIRHHYSNYHEHGRIYNEQTSSEAKFIDKLQKTVESNLADEQFDIIRLCRAMGMSRSQLHRKIKALLDTTPALYIRAIRLEKAKFLLASTEKTISEIAYETGFKSPSYFAYSFNENMGESPTNFRESCRKNIQ
jgi:signal transduction histidine kinase/DNA-binding response OmpR family regulator/ligand-binding sensor domain-containing protein